MNLGSYISGKEVNGVMVKCWITLNTYNSQLTGHRISTEQLIEFIIDNIYLKERVSEVATLNYVSVECDRIIVQGDIISRKQNKKGEFARRNQTFHIKCAESLLKGFIRDKKIDMIITKF